MTARMSLDESGRSLEVRRGASRLGAALVSVLAAALLGGCGLPNLTSGIGGGMFGGGQKADVDRVTEEQMLAAAKADPNPSSTSIGKVDPGCPKIDIAPHEGSVTVYETGRVGDALAVVHRGEVTKMARECSVVGSTVSVRYGVSGRVLLGPRGQTSTVSLPLNVYAADASRQRIANDTLRVDTQVAVDKPIGYFSVVRTLTFNVPPGSRAGDFRIYVAFDQKIPGAS